MVLRFDGTRRPGLVDCDGVETCWGVCCLSAAARLGLVVLIDSIAEECRGWWDMMEEIRGRGIDGGVDSWL